MNAAYSTIASPAASTFFSDAPSWRLWFPAGSDDPDLVLIRIEPSAAEYWDRTGANRLEFLWRAGKALLQREKTRDDELSGHAKVDLGDDSPLK